MHGVNGECWVKVCHERPDPFDGEGRHFVAADPVNERNGGENLPLLEKARAQLHFARKFVGVGKFRNDLVGG